VGDECALSENRTEADRQEPVTDNAGGGIRGLRARPSAELFEAVHHTYGINGLENSVDLGGSNTLNLLVTDGGSRYVVRVYRPYVTEARLADIQFARRELSANGVPCPDIIPTRDGRHWTVFDGRVIEVERYVDSDGCMDTWERLVAGLPLLGRIHATLNRLQFSTDGRFPLFANHIEPQKALSMSLKGIERIRGWRNPSSDELRLAENAEKLARLVFSGERELAPMLPRQVVHGDFWHNNVFFRDGGVALVTDFDFMGERARIDDLALTLYYFDCSNGPVTEDRLGKLRSLINAYDSGLSERLSLTERLALPLAMARQPLWSIGGWIAMLDNKEAARRHAAAMFGEVEWALGILRELERWKAAFK
jgi:Ser/Thr protein kinase RdoA (MazF antagonist)